MIEEKLVAIPFPRGSAPRGLEAGRAPRAVEPQVADCRGGCIRGREKHQGQGQRGTTPVLLEGHLYQVAWSRYQAWSSEKLSSSATLSLANPPGQQPPAWTPGNACTLRAPPPSLQTTHLCGQRG